MNHQNTTLIWDLPLRIFHWSLAGLVFYSWYSMEVLNNLDHHFLSGYAILTLLIFRLIWGIIGPENARFSSFIRGPRTVLSYLKGEQPNVHGGHNPLGALSVMLLLTVVSAQVISGLFSDDEYYYFGPLSSFVSGSTVAAMTEFHAFNFNIVMGAILLHILAILYYVFIKKHSLIVPMITGYKKDLGADVRSISGSKVGAALVVISCAAAIVYAITRLAA